MAGAGLVGKTIAADLAREHEVWVADIDPASFQGPGLLPDNVGILSADLSDPGKLKELVSDKDLVVNATPGSIGFGVLERTIETGTDAVDISFFPEDPLSLDEKAKMEGVSAIVDGGVAPGLDNLLLGYCDREMAVREFECLVGGLPVARYWPFAYKAPFSPSDVIEEYLRPARIMERGRVVTKPALSDLERVDLPEVGTLEAFNTDGLRTLLYTMPHVPEMREKTLRYPGHTELIQALKRAGFFEKDPVAVGDAKVRPLDMTSEILREQWRLGPDEPELTVMRVTVEGERAGKEVTRTYHLLDRYDPATGRTSMARTTGYTCTALVRLVGEGLWTRKGVSPPEWVGRDPECFETVLAHLEARGVGLSTE